MESITRTTTNDNLQPQVHTNGFITHEEATAEAHEAAKAESFLKRPADDDGFALCVSDLHGDKIGHCDALGWLFDDGKKWTREAAEAHVKRLVIKTMRERASVASLAAAQDPLGESKYDKIVQKSIPNNSRVNAIMSLLQTLVIVSPDDFDNHPDLLNCNNGVVDLRTGELYPHSADYKFMYCVPWDYKPSADYSTWDAWLTDAVGGAEIADWMQVASGYSLTGRTQEEIVIYLKGKARAGKGTFTETFGAVLGVPLAKEVNFSTFTEKRGGDSQNFDLAPLKPCRVVFASESNSYERFNEAKVKALTGGNEIYCAFKHKDHFNYRPQFKIWLSSNQPVNADPDDDAVWGRIRVIEFPNSYLGKEDKTLKENMRSKANLEGVLAWAVEGAIKWYKLGKDGLPELESSARTKAKQRGDLDDVQVWLDECCVIGDDNFAPNGELYKSYKWWCENNGVSHKQKKGLTQSLQRKGFYSGQKRVNGKPSRGIHGFCVTA